ncbi:hypothetical protein QJS66_08155 [Kocuria rhizophila]|nr:hypothetical protein QJS66_08155 [Kocuria rhizophila]
MTEYLKLPSDHPGDPLDAAGSSRERAPDYDRALALQTACAGLPARRRRSLARLRRRRDELHRHVSVHRTGYSGHFAPPWP